MLYPSLILKVIKISKDFPSAREYIKEDGLYNFFRKPHFLKIR